MQKNKSEKLCNFKNTQFFSVLYAIMIKTNGITSDLEKQEKKIDRIGRLL